MSAVVTTAVLAFSQLGCETPIAQAFSKPQPTRQQAIENCVESVPADAVPYGDVFSDCMEAQGWTWTSASRPRG